MRNALRPLFLCVLGFRALNKSCFLPQTRRAKNRTDAFEEGTRFFCVQENLFYEESAAKQNMQNALWPLFLRVLGFRALKKSCFLPQTRRAKNRTNAFEEGMWIFCVRKKFNVENAKHPPGVLPLCFRIPADQKVVLPSSKTICRKPDGQV